ncbi:MAG: hypothetical protein SFU87_21505 [Chitinophagaceae bacterium]|nr:hypothetical protein [Chitinophagaceae bacterium]
MTKRTKTIVIALSAVLLFVIGGGLYFLYSFFSAFAPPKVIITKDYISTNRDFINGVTIEKINVDSIGSENYPVKYTVTYWTSCGIDHPEGRPPNPPDKIYFKKEGKYWWTEEYVNIPFIHGGLSRHTTDSTNRLLWSISDKKFRTCPMEFKKEQWYFITIGNPQVTGIFFYIDKSGDEHQYFLPSGVSPI